MSKTNLWTVEDALAAAGEGWRLITTFENERKAKPEFEIAATTEPRIHESDKAAGAFVVSRARMRSELHVRALQCVMHNKG